MRVLSFLFIASLLLASCTSEVSDSSSVPEEVVVDTAKPEPSQEELTKSSNTLIAKVIDASSLNLQLNGESKWVINDESYTQLLKIKQQIYAISGNMENYEVSSYNEMGKEFLEFVNLIPNVKDEKANIEFQKIISATKNQCTFLLESNLQQSQISVINLSIIYYEVPNYFESK